MTTLRIIVCTPDQANVMQGRLTQDGFDVELHEEGDMVFWDATQANPGDPEMIFRNHSVLIGSRD